MKGITIWNMKNLMDHASTCAIRSDDIWVPCRPIGRTDVPNRIKALWMVFKGKADVVIWPADQ